jgi:hypothetical protein
MASKKPKTVHVSARLTAEASEKMLTLQTSTGWSQGKLLSLAMITLDAAVYDNPKAQCAAAHAAIRIAQEERKIDRIASERKAMTRKQWQSAQPF